jgi:hypothetical protein
VSSRGGSGFLKSIAITLAGCRDLMLDILLTLQLQLLLQTAMPENSLTARKNALLFSPLQLQVSDITISVKPLQILVPPWNLPFFPELSQACICTIVGGSRRV